MRLTPRCFALSGFAYIPPWSVNAGFVAGDLLTLVVDSGPTCDAAATIYGYASAARPGNRMALVNTEQHLDHLSGNGYFAEREVPIYGHASIARRPEELAGAIAEYAACISDPLRRAQREELIVFHDTRISNPSQPLGSDSRIDLGGLSAELLLTPGHTPSNLSVYVPDEGVIFCGDCVVSGYIPNLEAGGPRDWRRWLESLARLDALGAEWLVCGHGPIVQGTATVAREISRVRAVVERAIETGRAPTA